MSDTYHTIAAPSQALYTEQRSKFLAFAHRIASPDDAKNIVKEYANKYHDARHVCWAYMLGADRTRFLSSDNGEPSGTAGKPILGQINSFGLTDIVIVVVRYFGGIKLGTSGLIAAYREAARMAITQAEIIECHEETIISFTYPYMVMNDVMKAIKMPGIKILSQEFDNTCRITLTIRSDNARRLSSTLSSVAGVSLTDMPES